MFSAFKFRGSAFFWFLITGLFLLVIYSPSLIEVFPLFQIKKFEINTSDPNLRSLVKEGLNRYKNNWLLLRLHLSEFGNFLREGSFYYVEGVFLKDFDPFEGTLKLELSLNRPIFRFNENNFLSENGRIFRYPGLVSERVIIDKTRLWKVGDLYDSRLLVGFIELSKGLNVERIKVENFKISVKGKVVEASLPRGCGDLDALLPLVREVKRGFPNRDFVVNLFGSKGAAVKIYKE